MFLYLFAIALAVSPAGAARVDNPAEKVLRALDTKFQLAGLKQDTRTLGQLLSDDWMLIASSGKIVTRPAFLALVGDPSSRLEVNDSSEVTVRQHGSTAIVTGTLHERGSDHGKPYDAWLRYTDTWVLEANAWRMVSSHAGRITPPAGTP